VAALSQLYSTHAGYVRAFTAATNNLVRPRFLLPADRDAALFNAAQARSWPPVG